MLLIAHRGNLNGRQEEHENTVPYINAALEKGFDVEVDIWCEDRFLYLGHDKPLNLIDPVYLKNPSLWCHAKNLDALNALSLTKAHYFWHQNDDVTLTNKGYLWTFPGKKLFKKSICVLPETKKYEKINCYGICSDFILKYRENIKND